jgi:hypothetical protein
MVKRQKNDEGASLSQLALDRDLSPVGIYDPFADTETEPASSLFARTSLVDSEKPIKDAFLVLFCNTDPGIGHRDLGEPHFSRLKSISVVIAGGRSMVSCKMNRDLSPFFRVFNGIFKQIQEELSDSKTVSQNVHLAFREQRVDMEILRFG